tara:strand:- start:419 stop:1024 length:606 start_codon:yes stop_codon:yes gene_type:complete
MELTNSSLRYALNYPEKPTSRQFAEEILERSESKPFGEYNSDDVVELVENAQNDPESLMVYFISVMRELDRMYIDTAAAIVPLVVPSSLNWDHAALLKSVSGLDIPVNRDNIELISSLDYKAKLIYAKFDESAGNKLYALERREEAKMLRARREYKKIPEKRGAARKKLDKIIKKEQEEIDGRSLEDLMEDVPDYLRKYMN